MAFVTFWYYADAIEALNAKVTIDGGRYIKISIPRDKKKTPQAATADKVKKKPRQEFARQNTKARKSSQKGSSSRVTLFLNSYILLKCLVLQLFFVASLRLQLSTLIGTRSLIIKHHFWK
jgi:hypothetical protein